MPFVPQPRQPHPPKLKETFSPAPPEQTLLPGFQEVALCKGRRAEPGFCPHPTTGWRGFLGGASCLFEPHFLICQILSVEMEKVFSGGSQGHRGMGGCIVRRGWEARSPKLAQLACSSPVSLWESEFTSLGVQNLPILQMWELKTRKLPSGALDIVKYFSHYSLFGVGYLSDCESSIQPPAPPACPRPGTLSCALWYSWACMGLKICPVVLRFQSLSLKFCHPGQVVWK